MLFEIICPDQDLLQFAKFSGLYAQTPDVEEVDQAGLSCPEAPLTMIFR
jgi:hypothetical protein